MPILTSPKKLYKRMTSILVKSHLYMVDTDYLNDQWYGYPYAKWTWRLYIHEDYASLQREHNTHGIKWIWKNGENS